MYQSPLKIGCINESWRAGRLSAHSILFAVFWISFDVSNCSSCSEAPCTWISGAYSCEGQFSASCQVVYRGDVPHLHFATPFLLALLQTCPFLCSLPLFSGFITWMGRTPAAGPIWPETSCTFGDRCSGFIYLCCAHFLILADLLECHGGWRNQKTLIVRAA